MWSVFLFSSLHFSHSILAEAKNLSFNATAAFHAYSNIKAHVDAAEKEAKAAKQRASEALALVRVQDVSWLISLRFTVFFFYLGCFDANVHVYRL